MKKMLILIDFTELAQLALNQALALAKLQNATLVFCHVTDSRNENNTNQIKENFKPYIDKANEVGVLYQTHIAYGSLIAGAKETLSQFKPDLVVAGTHGKQGILQHIFGSKIFHLIKEIDFPVLVVNNQSKVATDGFKKVLIPVSHHSTYLEMLQKTTKLLAIDGKIVIFAVVKYGLPLDSEIIKNIALAKQFLTGIGVENEYFEIVADQYSEGYSKETLHYLRDNKVDLITIFTRVAEQNNSFGLADKENIILNDLGLTVLCVDC